MNVLTIVNASTAVWRSEHFIRMSVTVCSALIPIAHFTMYTRGVNNFLIHLSLQRRDLQNFVNNSKTIHHRENARNITVCSYFGLSVITISLLLDLYRILFYHCAFSSFFFPLNREHTNFFAAVLQRLVVSIYSGTIQHNIYKTRNSFAKRSNFISRQF